MSVEHPQKPSSEEEAADKRTEAAAEVSDAAAPPALSGPVVREELAPVAEADLAPVEAEPPAEAPSEHVPRHEPSEAPAPTENAAPGPAAAPSAGGTAYCVACGAEINRDDRFCHACGRDSQAAPPPPPRRPAANPSEYNRLTALLLCLLLGFLGFHRFYVGKVGTGIVWLLTLGFIGVGQIYDLVMIATGEFRDIDGRRLIHWDAG
jgi:hypothetical protein